MCLKHGFILAVGLLASCGAAPVFKRSTVPPSVRFEIRTADTVPSPSRIKMLQVGRTDPWTGVEKFLHVDSTPVFTNADVVETRVLEQTYHGLPPDYTVELTLTSSAKSRFAEFTGKRVGLPIAMLVEGKVISAPLVMDRIPGGKCWMGTAGLGQELATQIAKGIVGPSSFQWPRTEAAPKQD